LSPGDGYGSGRWAVDAGDHIQQGRLAAAGFADDTDKLSGLDVEIDGLQCGKLSRRRFVSF